MKKLILTALLLLSSFCFTEMKAQPPDPGGGGNPGCFPPPCVPIDGGLSWLLIAGTLYGGKKVFDLSKEENNEG